MPRWSLTHLERILTHSGKHLESSGPLGSWYQNWTSMKLLEKTRTKSWIPFKNLEKSCWIILTKVWTIYALSWIIKKRHHHYKYFEPNRFSELCLSVWYTVFKSPVNNSNCIIVEHEGKSSDCSYQLFHSVVHGKWETQHYLRNIPIFISDNNLLLPNTTEKQYYFKNEIFLSL